ncbi:hypothetical protein V8G61_08935 [Gaetbulibacter sp. M240]|uniref:hypothetical protein n=1 Tax=Gaetbulibacter sp. M240 TaxID=3126511 RepID=UPI00374F76D4
MEKILDFFKRHQLDRNLEAFDFFEVLNAKDKIPILENLVSRNDNRFSVYSILCNSYAEIGEVDKAYDLIDYMYDNLSDSFFASTIISIRDRIDKIPVRTPKSIIEQYKEIESLEMELMIDNETEILIGLIKEYLENKY